MTMTGLMLSVYRRKTIEEYKKMWITVNLLPLVNTIKDITTEKRV